MSDIERLHVVLNPEATRWKDPKKRRVVQARLQELRDSRYGSRLASPATFIETPRDPKVLAQKLDDTIGDRDVAVIIGGDGTNFLFNTAIMKHAQSAAVERVRRLKLGGGYANDGALQLNKSGQLDQPSKILDRNRLAIYLPMHWQATTLDGVRDDYPEVYATVNGSAAAALALEQPENRTQTGDSRVKKGLVVLRALRTTEPHKIQSEPNGMPRAVFELGFGNGRRMAEFNHCFPLALTDPDIFRYELEEKAIIRGAARFQFGRLHGIESSQPYTFTLLEPTPVQLDGEPHLEAANTTITVEPHPTPVYAYSTLL